MSNSVNGRLEIDDFDKKPKDVIGGDRYPLHLVPFYAFSFLFVFVMVKLFGRLAYKRKYLKGKWFKHIWSPGWRWAYNGMFAKLFFGHGRGLPWPVSSQGTFSRNIDFEIDDLNLFQGPMHYQAFGNARIRFGKGTYVARGAAIITTNHDLNNPEIHSDPKDVEIGESCWLGTNAVVMPGVTLGPHTVVGANAVVTKSFPDGYCMLAGVPARKIKELHKKNEQS